MKFIEKILGKIRRWNKERLRIKQLRKTFVDSFWIIKDDIEDELIKAERDGTNEKLIVAQGRQELINQIINYGNPNETIGKTG